eukprot:6181455-Pleurochrysis_carterae.AAC.3
MAYYKQVRSFSTVPKSTATTARASLSKQAGSKARPAPPPPKNVNIPNSSPWQLSFFGFYRSRLFNLLIGCSGMFGTNKVKQTKQWSRSFPATFSNPIS